MCMSVHYKLRNGKGDCVQNFRVAPGCKKVGVGVLGRGLQLIMSWPI